MVDDEIIQKQDASRRQRTHEPGIKECKKSVREYYQDLTRLEKIYGREEKRNPVRRNAGGHRK